MSTTNSQDSNFISAVINNSLLEEAIDWISDHMNPEDVFSSDDLERWATDNGMVKEEE